MCEFKNELQKLGHMEKTMSKILSLGISRDLRGPHGVIMSRRIMSMTQPSSIENLEVDYIKLSELWLKLANYLVRFSLNNVNLETIVETYDQIVKNERDINYKLIKKRCINEN
ncbi:hypothetical protein [Planococcus sp. MB-3u-09]|nr:hypothetical protein [Planococcus sp. MB-3u-09]PKH37046.1 hypothetical protein CXF77_12740 [Planococcus sp. MB-3u-09]